VVGARNDVCSMTVAAYLSACSTHTVLSLIAHLVNEREENVIKQHN